MVAEDVLQYFEGILCTDSWQAWNKVGFKHQKCILHYYRNLYPTIEKNKSAEFAAFWTELYNILKTATEMHTGTPMIRIADQLKSRLNMLIYIPYHDKDCKRYVRRLKRESSDLFSCLRENNVNYHNNFSERAIRLIAAARKNSYGN